MNLCLTWKRWRVQIKDSTQVHGLAFRRKLQIHLHLGADWIDTSRYLQNVSISLIYCKRNPVETEIWTFQSTFAIRQGRATTLENGNNFQPRPTMRDTVNQPRTSTQLNVGEMGQQRATSPFFAWYEQPYGSVVVGVRLQIKRDLDRDDKVDRLDGRDECNRSPWVHLLLWSCKIPWNVTNRVSHLSRGENIWRHLLSTAV